MVETELGEWRRTHYSKELDASMAGIRCDNNGLDFKHKRSW